MIFGSIRKVPTECPHCGFTQQEPVGLISTYCRGCGDHYTVARKAPPPPLEPRPSFARRVREKLLPAEPRLAACLDCGRTQKIPPHTQSAACHECGSTIDLHHIEIAGHSTRIVRTHGNVHIGRDGYLNSTRVICGNAVVEGRIAGKITCAGTLRFKGSGLCRSQITAQRLVVDRGATLRFPWTLRVGEIEIRGRVEADIECTGTLHIGRYGGLEGDVQSRSMIVDKGGYYAGEVQVNTAISRPDPQEAIRNADPDLRAPREWQARLAFG